MTTEVDLFEDQAERPGSTPESAEAGSAPTASKKSRKRRSIMSDPVIQAMVTAAAAVIILWTAAIASSIVFGLANPPAPRTQVERQLNMLEGVVKAKPKSTTAWSDYASAMISAKQYSAADEVIERGLKLASEKSLILVQKARLARKRGDDDAALKLCAEAIKTAKAERLADVKKLSGKGSKARIDPKGLPGGYIITAEIQAERQQWRAVVTAWTEFLKIEPTDCLALVARGDAQAKLNDKKGAEQSYREALKFIPDMPEALKGLKAIGASEK